MKDNAKAAPVAMNSEGAVPQWIELLPTGKVVQGRDRRQWFNPDPQRILNAFRDGGRSLVIDWEHDSELNAKHGKRSPAAGWIEELALRGGAIWGRVNWSTQGRADVAGRGYRFISPVFSFGKTTLAIERLTSAALTHEPNLELKALNRMDDTQLEETILNIRRKLGLIDDASEDQILAAIEELKNAPAMNRARDAERYVPRADYETALGQLNELRGRERERHDEEIVRTVDSVISVGDPSFPPANRNSYLAMCREEGGLDRFREIMVPDPARSLSRTETAGRIAPRRGRFDEQEEAILQTMGVDPSKVGD